MKIVLESNLLEVTKIVKKTTSKFFSNLKVGDVIHLSIPVKALGSSRGRSYAGYIKVVNVETLEECKKSFNELGRLLDCFEFNNFLG